MKSLKNSLILLVLTMLASQVVVAQDNAFLADSDTGIKKTVIRKMKRDAARLALRMNAKNEDLRYQDIEIPKRNIDMIFDILTNVYKTDETAQSISKCNVHTHPNPSIDHFVVIFDKNVEWAAPLRDGINETEDETINELLYDYDLNIEKHVQWNDTQDAITIRSKSPKNMAALANEFYNVAGVDEIDLGIPKVPGNDINLRKIETGWEVEYVLRFGSFGEEEGNIHIWKYAVSDDGNVKFLSEGGHPLPEWMKCDILNKIMVSKI